MSQPNFKTDVHRTQTKKWADAKSYSYEGDDWGGYDDYGDYQEDPPPPPIPKATGFRQRGQASISPTDPTPAPITNPLPPQPLPQSSAGASQYPRRGSFEQGDDQANFSPVQSLPRYYAAGNAQGPPAASAGSALNSARTSSEFPPRPIVQQPPPILTSQPQPRYSGPGEAPIPQTAPGPAPSQPVMFPPRKASLSGIPHSDLPPVAQAAQPQPLQAHAPQMQLAPGAAPHAEDTSLAVPEDTAEEVPTFTFVRPSDIYKRIEEEKEKVRRASMESGRTSLDSRTRSIDGQARFRGASASPARTDSPDKAVEAEQSASLKQPLSTVAERNSEYIMDAPPPPAFPEAPVEKEIPAANRQSFGLPQLGRMSAFGAGLWNFDSSSEDVPAVPPLPTSMQAPETSPSMTENAQDSSLHEKPSLGFRSAVDHAFATNDDQSSTMSPRSTHGSQRSTEDSDVSRSDSTAGISPIMTTAPVNAWQQSGELDSRLMSSQPPPIPEESGSPESRPTSASTVRSPEAFGHKREVSSESASTAVPRGYRRDMNPPSRSWSPARPLTIETQQEEPKSAAGEFSGESSAEPDKPSSGYGIETSPGTANPDSAITSSSRYSNREADFAETIRTSQGIEADAAVQAARTAPSEFMNANHGYDEISRTSSPYQRGGSGSPSKGRVRDLATKYDEKPDSGADSPTGSISSWASSRGRKGYSPVERGGNSPTVTSPVDTSRNPTSEAEYGQESYLQRPSLPGGWISYDNIGNTNTDESDDGVAESYDGTRGLTVDTMPKTSSNRSTEELDLQPTTKQSRLAGYSAEETGSNPMAAVSAAGAAMGESIKAALGMQTYDDSEAPESVTPSEDDMTPDLRERGLDMNNLKPDPLQQKSARAESPAAPPPPPKDTPKVEAGTRGGYFNANEAQLAPPPELSTVDTSSKQSPKTMESSPDDENDRLTQDIYRNLGQSSMVNQETQGSTLGPQVSSASYDARASSIYPREYDSYWGEKSPSKASFEPMPTPPKGNSPLVAGSETFAPAVMPQTRTLPPAKPGLLDKKFSWEIDDDMGFNELGEDAPEPDASTPRQPPVDAADRGLGLQTEHDEEDQKPQVYQDASMENQETDTTPSNFMEPMSPNLADDKPPVPLKSPSRERFPADFPDNSTPRLSESAGEPALTYHPPVPEPDERPIPTSFNVQPASDPNVMPFKDIMAMKYPGHRIETFNSAREQFATMQTGLGDWLAFMVSTNPEHAVLPPLNARPTVNTTGLAGSVKTKFASPFKPGSPSSATPTQQQPYYQQYLDSAATVAPPLTAQSGGATPSPTNSPAPLGMAGRRPSQQMGSRGKDLLHSAGVFGGKATSGAKGLFAKGKSKFKANAAE